ncbi:Aste57867_22432 [Aphanomyces stellatus]|uniref:Aste57867_22432 protein n=1 Tax=Aphanomyces stellatus TaxID=120398 RepID=A0A485LLF1_9STRA|nr:hypothetical protein As57867_022362 [Aphanomyces stellatus]VFT99094.1 Aste57867_22432 [Aphanomyces stellatus]
MSFYRGHPVRYTRPQEIVTTPRSELIEATYEDENLTSLVQAARSGDAAFVRQFMDKGDFDEEQTPLMVACKYGFADIAALLLGCDDIDVNDQDYEGKTALYVASGLGHDTLVELLLEHPDINVNLQMDGGNTPLYRASGLGHDNVVKLLLDHPDIDVDVPNDNDDTAITRAAFDGQFDIVRLLVESGKIKNINVQPNGYRNALCNAFERRQSNIATYLVAQKNVDVNVTDKDGNTPLLFACLHGNVEALHLLRQQRPELHDINFQNKNKDTCLTVAIRNGHEDLVRDLFQIPGIDINIVNKDKETPLSIAMSQRNMEIITLTLRHLQITNQFVSNELGPIFFNACRVGLTDLVQFLLDQDDCYVNWQMNGMTCLHVAVQNKNTDIVSRLLDVGNLRVDALNDYGRTALQCALESKLFTIAELFPAKLPTPPLHFKDTLLIELLAAHLTIDSSLNLLLGDFPFQSGGGDIFIPTEKTSFSWSTFLDSSVKVEPNIRIETIQRLLSHPTFATVSNKLLLVRQLAFTKDQQGREALHTTDATTRDFLKGLMHFCGRYEIFDGPPIHISPTAVVVNAYDHGICLQLFNEHAENGFLDEKGFVRCNQSLGRAFTERSANQKKFQRDAESWKKEFQIWDTDKNGTMSEVEFLHYCRHYFGEKIKVAMKFMRNADEHERELTSREGLSSDFVLHTLLTLEPHVLSTNVSSLTINGELQMSDYPHVLVMPAADRSLEDIHLKERPNDAKVRSMLYEVAVALSHLHEKNIVHGDVKKLNVLRVQSALKLIDLDAATKIGDPLGTKFSSGILPPEMFYKLKNDSETQQYATYWNSSTMDPTFWKKLKPKDNYVVKSFRQGFVSRNCLPYDLVHATTAIDMWSFGCLMYQMTCGAELVASDLNQDVVSDRMAEAASWTPDKLKRRIDNNISDEMAHDLVSKLLVVNPDERLNLDQVLTHAYFTGVVNWEPMASKFDVLMEQQMHVHEKVDQVASSLNETASLQKQSKDAVQKHLQQTKEDVLCGFMQGHDVLVPTSFVLLPFKVEESATRENTAIDFCKRLMTSGKILKSSMEANKPLGDALVGLTSDKTLYLYLIDEVTGDMVTNDPNGVYPIEIPTTNVAFLATAMPLIQGGLSFLKSVKGISGLMKSFGVPSMPDLSGLNLVNQALVEPTCTFGVLRDAVPDVPVERVRGAALRELTRVFETCDEDRTFGALQRVILESGRVVWTNEDEAKDIRERKRMKRSNQEEVSLSVSREGTLRDIFN